MADIDYFGSQPWRFPHGIMIGFRASTYAERSPLAMASWWRLAGMAETTCEIPAKLSIALRLIDDWAERRGFLIVATGVRVMGYGGDREKE